jgi:crotonobetainyl-CoA:carnitine CoA-transferase CaiB-like acyl-CoA transferase
MARSLSDSGALAGLLVADFSRVLAGPLATMTLGDLGADVVKVERPGTGDDTRTWGPPFTDDGTSTYYLALNRNKRSVVLDLDDPADVALAGELARRADVLVESFRPGLMARWGLDFDTLAAANPGLVYCSVSAFGSGPDVAGLPGYDLLFQGLSGLMSVTGWPDGPPTKVGAALVDMVCGLQAAIAILGALQARAHTKAGQRVEATLIDAGLSSLLNQGSGYLGAGVVPGRLGNRHPSIAPYQSYPDRDGRQFIVAVGNDRIWRRLCEVLGLGELADDPRFATNTARRERVDELEAILGERFATDTADGWIARLGAAGVPAGAINDIAEAYALADRLGLGAVAEDAGTRFPAPPLRLDGTPAAVRRAPPALGEHSEEIRAWLER